MKNKNKLLLLLLLLGSFTPSAIAVWSLVQLKAGWGVVQCAASSSIPGNQDGMVASISNIGSGQCNVTLTSGYFSATPICIGSSGNNSSAGPMAGIEVQSVTAMVVKAWADTGGAPSTINFQFFCIGAP